MRIISKKTLTQFYSSYTDSEIPFKSWSTEAFKEKWKNPQEIKEKFRSASILKNNRVVFNIAGNKYQLVVTIDYNRQVCFIKFIGTHKQYDLINAETYDGYSTNKN